MASQALCGTVQYYEKILQSPRRIELSVAEIASVAIQHPGSARFPLIFRVTMVIWYRMPVGRNNC